LVCQMLLLYPIIKEKTVNHMDIQVGLSTFSKANKTRDPQIVMCLYHKLLRYIEQAHLEKKLVLCPFDAAVIPLMSKLFWRQGYRQVKLITTLNQDTKSTGHLILSSGQSHEINFGKDIVKFYQRIELQAGIEGFVVTNRLMSLSKTMLLSLSVLNPIGNGMSYHITTKRGRVRVVCFGNVQQKVDDYLATNIPEVVSNKEIGEAYRQRWTIEVL